MKVASLYLRCRGLAIRLADLRIGPLWSQGLFTPSRSAIRACVPTDEQESGNQLDELRAWAARPDLDVTAEYISTRAGVEGQAPGSGRRGLADARLGVGLTSLLVCALDRVSGRVRLRIAQRTPAGLAAGRPSPHLACDQSRVDGVESSALSGRSA